MDALTADLLIVLLNLLFGIVFNLLSVIPKFCEKNRF